MEDVYLENRERDGILTLRLIKEVGYEARRRVKLAEDDD
jgi:hypothetical protein